MKSRALETTGSANGKAVGKAAHALAPAVEPCPVVDDAQGRAQKLAVQLGYDGPLDPDVIERGVTLQMRRTVEVCLETGRMLLVLKERVGHGNFLERLTRLAVEPRTAQKFMQAALKIGNATPAAHFLEAIGTQSKLLELLVLEDDEIQELLSEGSVLGIDIDELAPMSKAELRKALRDARQSDAAKKRLLQERNDEITNLRLKLEAPYQPSATSVAKTAAEAKLLEKIEHAGREVTLAMAELATLATHVLSESHPLAMTKAIEGTLELVCQRMADIVREHRLPVQFEEKVVPGWMKSFAAAAEKAS